MSIPDTPATREEMYLSAIANGDSGGIPETPYTRKEMYLEAIATGDPSGIPETPYTREEMYLDEIARNGGGGGGGDITVVSKSISANGTYTAPSGKAYSPVTVSVPASAVDTGTKSITSNGNNQDVVGYAAVDVAVPNSYAAGDEGKVVSNGQLVAQTAHAEVTQNGTIDTTLNDSVVVNVSGGGGGGASGTFSPAENLRSITLSDCVGKKNIAIWPTTSLITGTGRTHYGELWIDGIGLRMVGSSNSGGTSWSLSAGSDQVSWDSTTGTMTILEAAGGNYGGYYRSGMTYGYHAW